MDKTTSLRSFKGFGGADPLELPILSGNSAKTSGMLRAVAEADIKDTSLMERFASWRNRFQQFFLTQFETDANSMAGWISGIVHDDSKILFRIETPDKKIVGMYGFYITGEKTFSLEALMKGEKGGALNLTLLSVITVLDFCFYTLNLETATAQYFSDNISACTLYRSLGFRVTAEEPLFVSSAAGKTTYSAVQTTDAKLSDRALSSCELTREAFGAYRKKHFSESCLQG